MKKADVLAAVKKKGLTEQVESCREQRGNTYLAARWVRKYLELDKTIPVGDYLRSVNLDDFLRYVKAASYAMTYTVNYPSLFAGLLELLEPYEPLEEDSFTETVTGGLAALLDAFFSIFR